MKAVIPELAKQPDWEAPIIITHEQMPEILAMQKPHGSGQATAKHPVVRFAH